jgi:hypothetical protein
LSLNGGQSPSATISWQGICPQILAEHMNIFNVHMLWPPAASDVAFYSGPLPLEHFTLEMLERICLQILAAK